MGDGPGQVPPTPAHVRGAAATRLVLPLVILWAGVVAIGFLIVDVLAVDEHAINTAVEGARRPEFDGVAGLSSWIGSSPVIIATCLTIVAILGWRSRQWWLAMVPALALGIQVLVFLASSVAVGRERPDVVRLDTLPPTSSFPSGHAGAAAAVYIATALCATRIRSAALRIAVLTVCVIAPVGAAAARVYEGMHHTTDVIVGLLVGTACAFIAWRWLEVRDPAERMLEAETPADPASASALPPSRQNDPRS